MRIALLLCVEGVEVRGDLQADDSRRVVCEVQGSSLLIHFVRFLCDFGGRGDEVLEEEVCAGEDRGEGIARHGMRRNNGKHCRRRLLMLWAPKFTRSMLGLAGSGHLQDPFPLHLYLCVWFCVSQLYCCGSSSFLSLQVGHKACFFPGSSASPVSIQSIIRLGNPARFPH
jgi:hypothetical protein